MPAPIGHSDCSLVAAVQNGFALITAGEKGQVFTMAQTSESGSDAEIPDETVPPAVSRRPRLSPRLQLAAFLGLVLAAVASALQPRFPFGLADYDAAFHVGTFGILTLASPLVRWPIWRSALALFAVGLAIEAIQTLEPTRSASWRDVLFNAVGIGIGVVAIIAFRTVQQRLGTPKP